MITSLSFILLLQGLMAKSSQKAIFGSDNRRDIYQSPGRVQSYAKGIAHITIPTFITQTDQTLAYEFPLAHDELNLCMDEKFSAQPTSMVGCTAFFVSPKLLLTAGHCILHRGEVINKVTSQCSDFTMILNYQYNKRGDDVLNGLPIDNQIQCKRVIYGIFDESEPYNDYALIELKKPVYNRHYFKLSKKAPKKGSPLAILGHPHGLPLKYASNGKVLSSHKNLTYFKGSVDSFAGNSGSPVFNPNNGEVLGILVRGNDDFIYDSVNKCDRWNSCNTRGTICSDGPQSEENRGGMHIQRITPRIRDLIKENL